MLGSALEQPLRRLLGRPAVPLSWVARRNAEYDAMTAQLIRRAVRRDAVTVDAGANRPRFTTCPIVTPRAACTNGPTGPPS